MRVHNIEWDRKSKREMYADCVALAHRADECEKRVTELEHAEKALRARLDWLHGRVAESVAAWWFKWLPGSAKELLRSICEESK